MEINTLVNYPVKACLIGMEERGEMHGVFNAQVLCVMVCHSGVLCGYQTCSPVLE